MGLLLRTAVTFPELEIKRVWLRTSHQDIDCGKNIKPPKSQIYLAEQFTSTYLMKITASM